MEEIDIKRRDGIAHIVLNRPSAMSAVTLAMWRELAETFARFVADSDLRADGLDGLTSRAYARRAYGTASAGSLRRLPIISDSPAATIPVRPAMMKACR